MVEGCVWIASLLAAPDTSRNAPKFELVDRPTTVAVPLTVRLPLANGVPAVGLTRTFCHVNLHVTELILLLVTVKVSWLLVTELKDSAAPLDAPLILLPAPPLPVSRVTTTVGAVPFVSNMKPLGEFKTIV